MIPCVQPRGRITPAGAGKTLYTVRQQFPIRDHPRRCGENHSSGRTRSARRGSPPQVRGKPGILWPLRCSRRITPAGAGKTVRLNRNRTSCKDHPRRCGENAQIAEMQPKALGSPPQVRGKLSAFKQTVPVPGITPAGAGKTVLYAACNALHEDHPRRCGENSFRHNCGIECRGSPPQVRGKHGETSTTANLNQDHPRRCGENLARNALTERGLGSPPQVRGKRMG